MSRLRISLLHLAPVTGDVAGNRRLVESAMKVAAGQGADWAITPELCIPGYLFANMIGTDWILPQPDPWMQGFCRLVKDLGMTAFLSHPHRDPETDKLYNTVFVVSDEGEIVGKHSKVKALHGAEAWSTPGEEILPLSPQGIEGVKVGILICADAYKNEVAAELQRKGAQVLVSPSAWGPGQCGPDGEWERRSGDTGLPIMVCNRTGVEPDELDYRGAESVVAQNGQRLLAGTSDRSVILTFDWDMDTMTLLSEDFHRTYLD